MEKLLQFALTWYGILIFFIFVSLWVIHLVMRTRRIAQLNAKVDQLVAALEAYQAEELEREVRADDRVMAQEEALVREKIQHMRFLLKKAYYGMHDKNRIAVFEAISKYKQLLAWATAHPFGAGVSDDTVDHLSFTFQPYYVLEPGLNLWDYLSCPNTKYAELSMALLEASEEQFYTNLVEHLAVLVRYSVFIENSSQVPSGLMQAGLSSLSDLPVSVVRDVFQSFFEKSPWSKSWDQVGGISRMRTITFIAREKVLECLWLFELGSAELEGRLDAYESWRAEAGDPEAHNIFSMYSNRADDWYGPGIFEPPSYKDALSEPSKLRQYLYEELELCQDGYGDLDTLTPPRWQ